MEENQEIKEEEALRDQNAEDPRDMRQALPEINEVALAGRLMNSPKIKNFGEDKTRAQFVLGVPRPRRGEKTSAALDFITVTAWHAMAERCADLAKGDGVQIQGRIRTWQDQTRRYHWQIEADMLQALDRRAARKTAKPQEEALKA